MSHENAPTAAPREMKMSDARCACRELLLAIKAHLKAQAMPRDFPGVTACEARMKAMVRLATAMAKAESRGR